MCAPSVRRSLGSRLRWWRSAPPIGGTCLNIGCIPSKSLLHATELFEEAAHSFAGMGIGVDAPKLDLKAMMAFKDKGVEGNTKGVEFLIKKNKIDPYRGTGTDHRARQGRGHRRGRRQAGAGDQGDRHRHRLGRGEAARHRDRRDPRGLLHRRADAGKGARQAARGRRRRDRAGARQRVAPARRRGDGGRVPRPHIARHGPRRRQVVPAHPAEAGLRLQARAPRSPASTPPARR